MSCTKPGYVAVVESRFELPHAETPDQTDKPTRIFQKPKTLIGILKTSLPAIVVVAALLISFATSVVQAASLDDGQSTSKILVQSRVGMPEARFNALLNALGGRSTGKIRGLDVHIVAVASQAEQAVLEALSHHPSIQFAEPDQLIEVADVVPNDIYYPNAWHLQKIGAPTAWDRSTGMGVIVAVLDSGVDAQHEDLWLNVVGGWNSASDNYDTSDVAGHGTNVAGVVAADSDNGLGVTSVAWQTRIMPVRVTDRADGWALLSDIASGLTWAADHGAQIANISFDVSNSYSVAAAAEYMNSLGGLVVVAAGNRGLDPGHLPSAALIAVSATKSDDVRTSWSSFGSYVDVSAPGSSIWTTANGGGYHAASGTSFSSPMTAGVLALIIAANDTLTPDSAVDILTATAVDLGEPGWDPIYGYGRVNAAAAVALATLGVAGDFVPPAVLISAPADAETVSGLVSIDVIASDNVGVERVELLVDGVLLGTDLAAPYAFSWDSSSMDYGTVEVLARAYDAAGNRGTSAAKSLFVVNGEPPVVTINSPADGSVQTGTIVFSANATGVIDLAVLRLYYDGVLVCSGLESATCSIDVRKKDVGEHQLKAVAIDSAEQSTSTIVNFTAECCNSGDSGNKGKGRG